MAEIAPGVYSVGQAKDGHVHAFLFDAGGELTLVDVRWYVNFGDGDYIHIGKDITF